MNIYKKLMNVQQSLKAPKDQFNGFGHYKYRSCESILEALKPLLKENGLVITFTDHVVEVGERFYLETECILIDTDDGESIKVSALAREDDSKKGMDGSQVTGASSSYARKYALNAMFAIDDNKDADATNTGTKEKKPAPAQQKAKKQEPEKKTGPDMALLDAMHKKPLPPKPEQADGPNWRKMCIDRWRESGREAETLTTVFKVDKKTTPEQWQEIYQKIESLIAVDGNLKAEKEKINEQQS